MALVGKVLKNFVVKQCTFHNDTKYQVEIIDYDKNRTLKPGESHNNWTVPGFSVDLIMTLPQKKVKINFPPSRYQNRTHEMSEVFEEHIRKSEIKAKSAFSQWQFTYNHPGGFEAKISTMIMVKNSWEKIKEKEDEVGFSVGGMIEGLELSASFREKTRMTRVDAYEREITRTSDLTLTDPCYFWQEIIVVKTNQTAPFDEIHIPTAHTETTSTASEPGKEKLVFCK